MPDKFRVDVTAGIFDAEFPHYFENFWIHCGKVANNNDWRQITVANFKLKPLGGKLIQTSTQGWYLRWDEEASHTAFVLKCA